MRFPPYERVLFEPNPLAEVICQLRFPRNLAIESALPVKFQDRISELYPVLEQNHIRVAVEGIVASDPSRPPIDPQLLARHYNFKDQAGNWTVSLSSTFVAVATSAYSRWEEFEARLRMVVDAYEACYRVSHYDRLGLRYRDVIEREALGLVDVPWRDLVRPELLGVLANPVADQDSVLNFHTSNDIQLEDSRLTLQSYFVKNIEKGSSVALMVDSDFWVERRFERIENDIYSTLNRFHSSAGQVFSWAIRDQLRDALNPRSLD